METLMSIGETKTATSNVDMFVRIKLNAYVWSSHMNDQANFRKYLQENEGKLIQVETDYLFNNQYNTPEFRLLDSHISEVVNDARIGKGKCKYCGTMLNEGQICLNYGQCPEYGIEWFTPENTFFMKYPKGLPSPKKELLSVHDNNIKIGTYYLESFPELDYLQFYNCRQTINFKFDGKYFYIHNSIGWNQHKHLPVPTKVEAKLIKTLSSITL